MRGHIPQPSDTGRLVRRATWKIGRAAHHHGKRSPLLVVKETPVASEPVPKRILLHYRPNWLIALIAAFSHRERFLKVDQTVKIFKRAPAMESRIIRINLTQQPLGLIFRRCPGPIGKQLGVGEFFALRLELQLANGSRSPSEIRNRFFHGVQIGFREIKPSRQSDVRRQVACQARQQNSRARWLAVHPEQTGDTMWGL